MSSPSKLEAVVAAKKELEISVSRHARPGSVQITRRNDFKSWENCSSSIKILQIPTGNLFLVWKHLIVVVELGSRTDRTRYPGTAKSSHCTKTKK